LDGTADTGFVSINMELLVLGNSAIAQAIIFSVTLYLHLRYAYWKLWLPTDSKEKKKTQH
jgi:hypothetical protein